MLHVITNLQADTVVGNRPVNYVVVMYGAEAVLVTAVGENKFCPFFAVAVKTFYVES